MLVCAVPQLHLVAGFQGAALGSFSQTFTFVNTSSRACTLRGWPRLVGMAQRRVVQGKPVVRVVVRAGRAASFDVYGEDYDHLADKPCRTTRVVQVVPPGARTGLSLRVRMPNCRSGYEVAPVIAGRVDRNSWTTVAPPHRV